MGEQAKLPLDLGRRWPLRTDLQQPSMSQRPQNSSQDVEYPAVDHLTRAWESAVTAFGLTCEQLKRRAAIPFLQWALSALGQPIEPAPTALPVPTAPPGQVKPEKIQLVELRKSLAEEKDSLEKMKLGYRQLERSLEEAKKQVEKMKSRCTELESRLTEEEEKRRKQTEMEAKIKRARDDLLSQMSRILKDSQKEDER